MMIGSSPAGAGNSPKVMVPPVTGWAAAAVVDVAPAAAVVGAALLPLLLLHAPATKIVTPAQAASDRIRWLPVRLFIARPPSNRTSQGRRIVAQCNHPIKQGALACRLPEKAGMTPHQKDGKWPIRR